MLCQRFGNMETISMKLICRMSGMFVLIGVLAVGVIPVSAGTVYENGPINGDTDAWAINNGFFVADTFTVSQLNSTVNGLSFGAWLAPGDTVTSVEVTLTTSLLGGTTYFDGIVDLTTSNCSVNSYNYNVCTETGAFPGVSMPIGGSYWLILQNASGTTGDPIYWDENSGVGCSSPGCPSDAAVSILGSIPSEAFTILGSSGSGGTTPEPGTLLLFATGAMGLAGAVRRKLL
jgi:hypothetical protein